MKKVLLAAVAALAISATAQPAFAQRDGRSWQEPRTEGDGEHRGRGNGERSWRQDGGDDQARETPHPQQPRLLDPPRRHDQGAFNGPPPQAPAPDLSQRERRFEHRRGDNGELAGAPNPETRVPGWRGPLPGGRPDRPADVENGRDGNWGGRRDQGEQRDRGEWAGNNRGGNNARDGQRGGGRGQWEGRGGDVEDGARGEHRGNLGENDWRSRGGESGRDANRGHDWNRGDQGRDRDGNRGGRDWGRNDQGRDRDGNRGGRDWGRNDQGHDRDWNGGHRGGRDWGHDGRRDWADNDHWRNDWERNRHDQRYRPYWNTHRDFSNPRYYDWRRIRHGYFFDYGYARILSRYYGRDYYWWSYDGWHRPYRPWRVGYVIPAWLWWEPLPWDLYYMLPPAPYGCRYIYADGDILLIAIASGIIIDALLYEDY